MLSAALPSSSQSEASTHTLRRTHISQYAIAINASKPFFPLFKHG